MSFFATIKIALVNLNSNKVRTSLTVLGIVIGIASVIVVYSAGEGINGLIVGQIESFGGSDMIETEVKVPSAKKGGSSEMQSGANLAMGVQITTLTLDDLEDINGIPNVIDSYAGVMSQEQVSYQNEMLKTYIMGVTASFIDIDKSEIDYGRFFTAVEDKSLAPVAVLGPEIKKKLFGDSDPIGQSIKIKKKKFKVIGVLKEKGAIMGLNFDNFIYVPIQTIQKEILGINHVSYMMHKVKDTALIEPTADEIRYILRENHNLPQPKEERVNWSDTGKDDFRVVSMTESMEILETVTGAITLLLLAIVAISLIVGGVGIMNIMYVSVTERTMEIGLRKAVGAKYANIMQQFLIESVIITIFGGIIGIIIGILISALIWAGATAYGLDWRFLIPAKAYIVALSFSALFGIIFGIYPARKAAKLDPIEALRTE